MEKKQITIGQSIIIGAIILFVGLFIGNQIGKSVFGGILHNVVETFIPGIIVGSKQQPACIKVMDTDKGDWSYITYLNGVETVTGGASGYFSIPDACAGK